MENFLNELNENEALRDDFLAQSSIDDAYEVAKPYLGDLSEEDFSKEMIGLAKNISGNDELDEEALESIQGGVESAFETVKTTIKELGGI